MIRRNVIANYLGTFWTMVMGVAFLPLYVRYLGVEAFGMIGIFAVVQAWLTLLDAGITPALTRETSRLLVTGDHGEIWRVLRTSESLSIAAGLVSLLALCIAAFALATVWLNTDELPPTVVTQCFILMGIIIAIRFPENVYRAAMIGLEHQVALNALTAVLSTLRSGGAVLVLIFISDSILAFFLWQAIISALTAVILGLFLYRVAPGEARDARISRITLKRIWRFSSGVFMITFLGTLLSQTDKLVLSAILPLREFGYYAFAATVAAYVRTLVQPIYQAVYPRLVALTEAEDSEALARLYHQTCQFAMVVMGSAAVWLIAFGQPILRFWTQDTDFAANVGPIMGILLIGFTMNGALNGPYYLQMASGWTSLMVRTNALMALILGPSIWLAVEAWGMLGGAGAWVVVNAIYLIALVQLMHRRILRRELMRWYTKDTLFPLAAAASAAFLCRLLIPMPDGPVATMLVLGFSGAMILAAAGLMAPQVRSWLLHQYTARRVHA